MKKSLKKLKLNVLTLNTLKQEITKGGTNTFCQTSVNVICHELVTITGCVSRFCSDECTNASYVPEKDHYVC